MYTQICVNKNEHRRGDEFEGEWRGIYEMVWKEVRERRCVVMILQFQFFFTRIFKRKHWWLIISTYVLSQNNSILSVFLFLWHLGFRVLFLDLMNWSFTAVQAYSHPCDLSSGSVINLSTLAESKYHLLYEHNISNCLPHFWVVVLRKMHY